MIKEISNDLIAKLDAIPALTGKVGLALGGRGSDPALSKAPLPLAWGFLQTIKPTDPASATVGAQSVQCQFSVFLVVPYISQDDMETTQLPLVETAVKAVRGTQAPSVNRWRFEGVYQTQINPDRIYYELRFSVNAHL